MHGRLKVRTSAEEAARKKEEQNQKVKAYRAAMKRITEKRSVNELDDEMMALTSAILMKNPDVFTLWNIRRECMLSLWDSLESDEKIQRYDKELQFAEYCLRENPKSYGGWHHRCWILEHSPNTDWNKEVDLCNLYLTKDERNFHVWDYRRFVVEKANVSPDRELEFCTKKIENNFSNYSSWHYRSKLLPILYPHETNKHRPISEEKLQEELNMVLSAAFTDPNDSSAWFYQRWLLGNSRAELDFAAAKLSKGRLIVTFTIPINLRNKDYRMSLNGDVLQNKSKFQSVEHDSDYHTTWIIDLDLNERVNETATLCLEEIDDNEVIFKFTLLCDRPTDGGIIGIKPPKFGYVFSEAVLNVLVEQLKSCDELLEYEPDSKWTLLTAALLMRSIDRKQYHSKSIEYLKKLETVDSLRMGYYRDLASKWNIEYVLDNWISTMPFNDTINLSNYQLTTLAYEQYLSVASSINLSDNELADRNMCKFLCFQSCKFLNINNTKITKLNCLSSLKMLDTIAANNETIKLEKDVLTTL